MDNTDNTVLAVTWSDISRVYSTNNTIEMMMMMMMIIIIIIIMIIIRHKNTTHRDGQQMQTVPTT